MQKILVSFLILASFAPTSHRRGYDYNQYLPLTGGTLTGDIITTSNISDGTYQNTPSQLATTTINFVISGGGAEIATGLKGFLEVPVDGVLVAWTLMADQSGAIKIDVWKAAYADYPPDNTDSMTNGHEPEIAASGAKAQDTDITDWSSEDSVSAGDILAFNVDSVTTITQCTISLKFIKDNQ